MSNPSKPKIFETLRGSRNSVEALRALYLLYKKHNIKFSLTYFCARAGIASKGYLSEVLAGKKKLNPLYAEGLIKAFDLKGTAANYLKVLIELDEAEDFATTQKLMRKKENLEKSLRVQKEVMPSAPQDPFFVLQVYSTLGLFKNQASFPDLLRHFGPKKEFVLRRALEALSESHLIFQDGEYWSPTHEQVVFSSNDDHRSHFHFLNSCLERAKEGVEKWYAKNSEAYFESSIISVNRKTYEELLPKIRASANELQSQLETAEADQLILFGIQVFPVAKL